MLICSLSGSTFLCDNWLFLFIGICESLVMTCDLLVACFMLLCNRSGLSQMQLYAYGFCVV